MDYIYKTKGTCSSTIYFSLKDNVVSNIRFVNGCDGNLKAIAALADGMTVEQVQAKCMGIRCGRKDTSCADQLARAIGAHIS